MKKMFLSSSFEDVIEKFINFINEDFKGKTVTFIPTASVVEEVDFYVESAKNKLIDLGMNVDLLDISKSDIVEIEKKLRNNDYIYVSGGNTFFLLQEMKNSGAAHIIIDEVNKGKVYIGESAGSVVASPNIEYINAMDSVDEAKALESYVGLNLIDFYPLPHYGEFPFKDSADAIENKYRDILDLKLISNTQVIEVKGNEISILW